MTSRTSNIFTLLGEESEENDDYVDDPGGRPKVTLCQEDRAPLEPSLHQEGQKSNSSSQLQKVNLKGIDIDTLTPTEIRKYYHLLIDPNNNVRSKLDHAIMNDVWESWRSAMPCFPNQYNDKLEVIKEFVSNPNQKEMIIYDCPPSHRYQYHQICGLLRLEHKTLDIFASSNTNTTKCQRNDDHFYIQKNTDSPNLKGMDGYKPINHHRMNPHNNNGDNLAPINIVPKTMMISKPDNWSWEFTIVSNEQEQLNQSKIKEHVQKNNDWIKSMKGKRCIDCRTPVTESQLFTLSNLDGLFCEKCIEKDKYKNHHSKHAYGRKFYD